jgi:hypothetical protein
MYCSQNKNKRNLLFFLLTLVTAAPALASCDPRLPYETGFENPNRMPISESLNPPVAKPMSITVAWCPSDGVNGYNVYASTISGTHVGAVTRQIDFQTLATQLTAEQLTALRSAPQLQLPGLSYGQLYYITATSFVDPIAESRPSNEISFVAFQIERPRTVCVWDAATGEEDAYFIVDYTAGDPTIPVEVQTADSSAFPKFAKPLGQKLIRETPLPGGGVIRSIASPLVSVVPNLVFRLSADITFNPGGGGC